MALYATQADLTNLGVPLAALATLTTQQINAVLLSASDFADTFFRARWGQTAVPLLTWDTAVTMAVARVAALHLLRIRGYNPNSTADQRFQQGYDESVAWFHMVQRQQAHPLVTLANNAQVPISPLLLTYSVTYTATGATKPNRGW